MYGTMPYMIPNTLIQTAPIANGLAGASNLTAAAPSGGALGKVGSLFSKINWGSLLSNAQKTLSVVNQAIPLYYQVKPVFKNLKTLGKIGKEFTKISNNEPVIKKDDNKNSPSNKVKETKVNQAPEPIFFL